MKRAMIACLWIMVLVTGCVTPGQEPVSLPGAERVDAKRLAAADTSATAEKSGEDGYLLPARQVKDGWEEKVSNERKRFNPWRSLGATLFIMGALLALNLYIRKGKIGRKTEPDAKIKLIEKFAVDQKKSLMLIQVEGQKVLLGVGPDRIERIVVFGGDDEFGSMLGEKLGEAAGVEAK